MLPRRPSSARAVLAGLALTLLVVEAAPSARAEGPPEPLCGPTGGKSSQLKVDGWVKAPAGFDLTGLQKLSRTTVVDEFFPEGQRKFTGVALARLLNLPQASTGIGPLLKPGPPGPQASAFQAGDVTRYSVLVTSTDCRQALFSAAELSPYWADAAKAPVIAFAQGGEAAAGEATGTLGRAGFARLIVPADARGGRRLTNVAGITVLPAPADANEVGPSSPSPVCGNGGPSNNVRLDGWVSSPESLDRTDLADLPRTTVVDAHFPAGQRKFTGVALDDLLAFPTSVPSTDNNNGLGPVLAPDVPGPQAPALQKNDLTRFAVMVTGSDCAQALFSAAELSRYWSGPDQAPILAYAQGDEAAPGDALAEAAPDQLGPDDTAPGQAAPGQAAPEQAAPEQAAPEQAAPEQAAPGETAPGETGFREVEPVETAPVGTAPDGTAPEGTAADDVAPDGAPAGGTAPAGEAAEGDAPEDAATEAEVPE
jgi:hypothetical protein